jgi:hypothetical protein
MIPSLNIADIEAFTAVAGSQSLRLLRDYILANRQLLGASKTLKIS